MNRTDLAQKLRALDGLTADEKSALLGLLHEQKRYGLVWEEKPEAVEELLRASLPVLDEVTERRIRASLSEPRGGPSRFIGFEDSQDGKSTQATLDFAAPASQSNGSGVTYLSEGEVSNTGTVAPHHLLIEGDNLHALTALSYTHAGRVDVIYIDPPYNTGNKDFKYNDRFVDREDAYRHSKWLSFMAKRLRLARTLLAETGVIFISIDDNEQAQLKLLCNEVFGEENFVANVIWQKNFSPKSSAKHFSDSHEYVLSYCKSIDLFKLNLLQRSDEQIKNYKNPDNDPRGPWTSGDLAARNHYSLGLYQIITPAGRIINGPPKGSYWRYSKESLESLITDNRIWFGSDGTGVPRIKRFLSEVQSGITPQTIWPHTEAGNTQEAKKEVLAVFGNDEGFFTTPKPLKLLNRILQLSTQKHSLILDFFAGSGTTLHAVMALNAEDGGTRQCILVTNNENRIAEKVCYERNRRVIAGYTKPNGEPVAGLKNNHLHYYRTGFVGRERTLANKRALVRAATALLCVKEGCFEEVRLSEPRLAGILGFAGWTKENGIDHPEHLKIPANRGSDNLRLFAENGNAFLVVYDESAIPEAVEVIRRFVGGAAPRLRVYVFAPGAYPYTDDFEEVLAHVDLVPLPDALYRAWQHLLPRPGEPQPVEDPAEAETPTLFDTEPAA